MQKLQEKIKSIFLQKNPYISFLYHEDMTVIYTRSRFLGFPYSLTDRGRTTYRIMEQSMEQNEGTFMIDVIEGPEVFFKPYAKNLTCKEVLKILLEKVMCFRPTQENLFEILNLEGILN